MQKQSNLKKTQKLNQKNQKNQKKLHTQSKLPKTTKASPHGIILGKSIHTTSTCSISTKSGDVTSGKSAYKIRQNDSKIDSKNTKIIPTIEIDQNSPLFPFLASTINSSRTNIYIPSNTCRDISARKFSTGKNVENDGQNSEKSVEKKKFEFELNEAQFDEKFDEILTKLQKQEQRFDQNGHLRHNTIQSDLINTNEGKDFDLDNQIEEILKKANPTPSQNTTTTNHSQSADDEDDNYRYRTPVVKINNQDDQIDDGFAQNDQKNTQDMPKIKISFDTQQNPSDDYISFETLLETRRKNHSLPHEPHEKPSLTPFADIDPLQDQTPSSYVPLPKPIKPPQQSELKTMAGTTGGLFSQLEALKAQSAALDGKSGGFEGKKDGFGGAQDNTQVGNKNQRLSPSAMKKKLIEEAVRQQDLIKEQQAGKVKSGVGFLKSKLDQFDKQIDTMELKALNHDDETISRVQTFTQNQEDFEKRMKEVKNVGNLSNLGQKITALGSQTKNLTKSYHPTTLQPISSIPHKNNQYELKENDEDQYTSSFGRSISAAIFFGAISAITARLCLWQIDRRVWKLALLTQREDAIFNDPMALEDLATLAADILENFSMKNLYHTPSPPIVSYPNGFGGTAESSDDINPSPLDSIFGKGKNFQNLNNLSNFYPTDDDHNGEKLPLSEEFDTIRKQRKVLGQNDKIPEDVLETPAIGSYLQTKLEEFVSVFQKQDLYDESSPLHQANISPNGLKERKLTIREVIGDDGGIYQAYRHHINNSANVIDPVGNPIGVTTQELLQNISVDDIVNALEDYKTKSQFHNVMLDGQYDYTNEMLVGPTIPPLDGGFKNIEVQKGYYIITPCQLYEPFQVNLPIKDEHGNHHVNLKLVTHSVLVNRGWIPQGLLPNYLNAPLTEHELYSKEDLKILERRIRSKHDFYGEGVIPPVPFPEVLTENFKLWDQDKVGKIQDVVKSDVNMMTAQKNQIKSAGGVVYGEINDLGIEAIQNDSKHVQKTSLDGNTASIIDSNDNIVQNVQKNTPITPPSTAPTAQIPQPSQTPQTPPTPAAKITPYSIEFETDPEPTLISSTPTPKPLKPLEPRSIPTPMPAPQYKLDANTKWADDTLSRTIYHQFSLNKDKLDRVGLGMNDVFKLAPELRPTFSNTKLPINRPSEPFSLINTRNEPLKTPLMPVSGVLNYGATFDLYSADNETAKMSIRGLDNITAYTFLTGPKFALEMGISPSTMHLPTGQTVSLLSRDQHIVPLEQAALTLHLPTPVIDCQDPAPYRSRVIPIDSDLSNEFVHNPGRTVPSYNQNLEHFDSVRMSLKRKSHDDYLRFKTMPETHLGYAVTWGSFAAIGAYMTAMQLKKPVIINTFKKYFGNAKNAVNNIEEPKKKKKNDEVM
jgi:cytochrome oxidase assembly protein ShyY1